MRKDLAKNTKRKIGNDTATQNCPSGRSYHAFYRIINVHGGKATLQLRGKEKGSECLTFKKPVVVVRGNQINPGCRNKIIKVTFKKGRD